MNKIFHIEILFKDIQPNSLKIAREVLRLHQD